jgi:FkbM family methyltransferase
MSIRRGWQIAKRGYRQRGLKAVISDIFSLIKSVWCVTLDRPVTNCGITICGARQLGVFQTAEIIAGRHEQEEAEFVREYIPDGTTVVELGGGTGYISLLANKVNDIPNHIVLEMNPKIIPVLRENIDKRGENISIDTSAYSARYDFVSLDIGETFKDTAVGMNSDGDIKSKLLLKLIDEYELEEFVLISDIEGAEAELLDEEFGIIKSHCPLIIIEFHPSRLAKDLCYYMRQLQLDYVLLERLGNVFVFQRLDDE